MIPESFKHISIEKLNNALGYITNSFKRSKLIKHSEITRITAIALLHYISYSELLKCKLTFLNAVELFNTLHITLKIVEIKKDDSIWCVMLNKNN